MTQGEQNLWIFSLHKICDNSQAIKLLYTNVIQFHVAAGKSKQFKYVLNIIPMARGLCIDYTILLQTDLRKMKIRFINRKQVIFLLEKYLYLQLFLILQK